MNKLIFFLILSLTYGHGYSQQGLREGEFHDPYNDNPKLPIYFGGEDAMYKFVDQNLNAANYPRPDKPQVTWLTFTITKKGRIKSIRIDKTSGPVLDGYAMRVLKKMDGRWTPGRQFGKYCEMEKTVHFKFKGK